MKKINEQQKENVVTLYQETDLTVDKIAQICNLSATSVSLIIKERGISPKRTVTVFDENMDKAVSMYQNGYDIRDILQKCKVPQKKLYLELDKRGIQRRNNLYSVSSARCSHPKRVKMLMEYQKGSSFSEIQRKLDVSYATIKKYVEQAIEDGEIMVSQRYSPQVKEYLQNVADIIVKSPVKLSIKEMARATKVDETKLRYQVAKREKLS